MSDRMASHPGYQCDLQPPFALNSQDVAVMPFGDGWSPPLQLVALGERSGDAHRMALPLHEASGVAAAMTV